MIVVEPFHSGIVSIYLIKVSPRNFIFYLCIYLAYKLSCRIRDLIRLKEMNIMLIDTRAMGFALTDAILSRVEARIRSALGPFSRWVLKATVRLEDVNADHGGDDKRCAIVVALRRHGVEIAEATNADLYVAIDKAADRMRRSVRRATKRHLTRDRRDPQRPGTLVTL